MKLYSRQEAIARMNMLAGCSKSFVFLIDYSQEQVYVEETAEVSPEELIYNLNGFMNEATMYQKGIKRRHPVGIALYLTAEWQASPV